LENEGRTDERGPLPTARRRRSATAAGESAHFAFGALAVLAGVLLAALLADDRPGTAAVLVAPADRELHVNGVLAQALLDGAVGHVHIGRRASSQQAGHLRGREARGRGDGQVRVVGVRAVRAVRTRLCHDDRAVLELRKPVGLV
jgi:hypothetical protein